MYTKPQKLVAEFVGTFAVVFFSVGAICADQFIRTASNGQSSLGLLGVAVAYGLTVAVMITALGHISGGHFNPAVTVGFWVTRKFSTFDTLAYWVAQIAGSVAAAYSLRMLPVDVWAEVQMGAPNLGTGISRGTGMAVEAILSFFVVLVFFATVADERGAFHKIAGFGAGLAVTMAVLFGQPFTGAALNPARAFGPALAASHWANHGVYWIGPLGGGVAAGWLYDTLFLGRNTSPRL